MGQEELIKEGLSVLKEQTYSRDMFGVTGEPRSLFKQTPSGGPRRGGLGRPTAAQRADLAQRQSMKRLQTAALDDTRTFTNSGDVMFGSSAPIVKLKNNDNYSGSDIDTIKKYYDNAVTNVMDQPLRRTEYNVKHGRYDTGEYGTLRPAMAASQAERLARPNLPSPSEDSVLGSFADRFMASGGRLKDAGSGSSKRGSRGNRPTTTPTATSGSSRRGSRGNRPTTTPTATATSQNFLKNIDPKLAAGIAAGTLGAAGLAAFVANRRRKKKKKG